MRYYTEWHKPGDILTTDEFLDLVVPSTIEQYNRDFENAKRQHIV